MFEAGSTETSNQGAPAGPVSEEALLWVLDAFGLGPAEEVRRVGGTASPKWAVASAKGRFVLRVRPAEFADDESIRFDHQALIRLARAGLPVPTPLARPDGSTWLCYDGRVYEVLCWVEGKPLAASDPDAVRALGAFLARFHSTLTDDIPPGKEGRLREDHPDFLAPYLVRLHKLAPDAERQRQLDRLGRQLDHVRAELDRRLYGLLPHCVIHGDVHPGNVFFRQSEVAAVYDFDYLSVQARARDVSDGLMFFASGRDAPLNPDDIRSLTQPFLPELARCRLLLQGYQSRIRLAEVEWQALPLLIRSRWIQVRLRGCRKVADSEKVDFVLDRFFEVIDWLDHQAGPFFRKLRAGL